MSHRQDAMQQSVKSVTDAEILNNAPHDPMHQKQAVHGQVNYNVLNLVIASQ